MTGEEKARAILQAYPNANHAVAFVQLLLDQYDEEGETAFDLLRKAFPSNPRHIVKVIRYMIAEEDKDGAGLGKAYLGHMKLAYTETFHDDFLKFVCAKLGMM